MAAPEAEISGKKGEVVAFANGTVSGTEVGNDSIRFGSADYSLAGAKAQSCIVSSSSLHDRIQDKSWKGDEQVMFGRPVTSSYSFT